MWMKRIKITGVGIKYLDGDKTLGVFFNSYDRCRHIAEYTPYVMPPRTALCGWGSGHWTNVGSCSPSEKLCETCFSHIPKDIWYDVVQEQK